MKHRASHLRLIQGGKGGQTPDGSETTGTESHISSRPDEPASTPASRGTFEPGAGEGLLDHQGFLHPSDPRESGEFLHPQDRWESREIADSPAFSDPSGLSDLLTDRDERALARFLANRERAPVEVRQYLSKKGILKSWHDAILERLEEMDLINEDRFCEGRIEHRIRAGQGPRRIQQELGSLGIDRDVAEDCLQAIPPDKWEESCLAVAEEKIHSYADRKDAYWKLVQFLNYRGFENVHIDWAMSKLKDNHPQWFSGHPGAGEGRLPGSGNRRDESCNGENPN